MKKKSEVIRVYTRENARSKQGQGHLEPMVSYQSKGIFRLNRTAAALLEVSAGDGLSFLHDTENGEWLMAKDPEGLPLTRCKSSGGALQLHSTIIRREIMESVEGLPEAGQFGVAKKSVHMQERKAYALITGKARK